MNKVGSVLVMGCAGFIGYHLSVSLLKDGVEVLGIDNLNEYYDVNLKKTIDFLICKSIKISHFKTWIL